MGGTRFTPLACMKSGLVVSEAGLRVKPSLQYRLKYRCRDTYTRWAHKPIASVPWYGSGEPIRGYRILSGELCSRRRAISLARAPAQGNATKLQVQRSTPKAPSAQRAGVWFRRICKGQVNVVALREYRKK